MNPTALAIIGLVLWVWSHSIDHNVLHGDERDWLVTLVLVMTYAALVCLGIALIWSLT